MSDETWCRDSWGDLKDWVREVIIAVAMVLIICVIVVLTCVGTYAAQGCLINKGHIAPHTLDGRYEYQITAMTFPRSEDPTFYLRGRIKEKAGREYSIMADQSLGEQAWAQGIGGYITIWSKNNHIIKYHVGTGRP